MRSRFSPESRLAFRHTEAIRILPAPSACECRVCKQPIAAGEASYGWQWRSTQRGHEACGWFVATDADAMYVLKRFEDRKVSRSDGNTAVDLGLVERRDGYLHATPLMKALCKYLAARKVAS